MRIGAAPVVGEEGEDGPGQGQDRHDEQDQNVVGRELVRVDVAVDKVGEHAHDGDLFFFGFFYMPPVSQLPMWWCAHAPGAVLFGCEVSQRKKKNSRG